MHVSSPQLQSSEINKIVVSGKIEAKMAMKLNALTTTVQCPKRNMFTRIAPPQVVRSKVSVASTLHATPLSVLSPPLPMFLYICLVLLMIFNYISSLCGIISI